MVYRGTVKIAGIIELDDGSALDEGTRVLVRPVRQEEPSNASAEDRLFQMGDRAVETGIADLATNIDHYLYGHPKADRNE